ncbi:MAG: response regulator [Proteobacteria bacterium]|nr:response regulator [Pseudomonadota bacterium]
MRLLIVDDEEEILHMLRRNFEMEGYEVTTTPSPREALELTREVLFNLVLTDIKMPGMSGVDLLVEIKRINPLANVIIMTGYSSMTHVVDCLGQGAIDYFVKPFNDLDLIIRAVDQARERIQRWRAAMGVER